MSSSSSSKKFDHLQIPLELIVSATDNFSDANLIGEDGFGKEYKGQLLLLSGQLINIVARRVNQQMYGQEKKEFWMEIWTLSKLKHKNIVSVVGFCYKNDEKIVIYKLENHGTLYKYLRDPALTWMQRLQICVGVAHALSYIYYDKQRDFSVIHRDIKSSKILLDDNWEAKLSGFELSITQTAARRNHLFLTDTCSTPEYSDITYIESGSVTHKSDMYSFGMVLFEVLCGKEAITEDKNNMFIASSARSHYEGGKLEDMIDPVLWKQMNTKSFEIFSETAYYCLKKHRSQRPNIDQIVVKLEQALVYQREHENPVRAIVDNAIPKSLKWKDLKHLEISLTDIKLATKNFAKEYLIGFGTYGEVYKAQLDHFDSKNIIQLEEKNEGERPKKRSTVAIKRILNREDTQGEDGFHAEIEMLTICKHSNIVSLLGFCEEDGHMILVYEYVSNGSLYDYLGTTTKLASLSWVQRIKISIDIANGLNYLHTKIEGERRIIHRDLKSGNILLGENWEAKIADFGLSKFRPEKENQQANKTLDTQTLAGTDLYCDPVYFKTGKLKNESDIYSLGVVLFEIMSGRFANDPFYTNENSNGIAPVARRHYNEGSISKMLDPRLMEETNYENVFSLIKGPDQCSLDAFSKIAYQCVAESQGDRPTAEFVVQKLEETLSFQENRKDHLKFSFEDIELATQNFSDDNLIGRGGFGMVYKGEVTHANEPNTIAAKRKGTTNEFHQGEAEFLMELQILLEYKHENIIGLVGYCSEVDERIIVYEYAPRGSLDRYLSNNVLTWVKRLDICIDIASGLNFLHGGGVTQEVVMHRDIKSANILLNGDWKAKITDFGISIITPFNKDIGFNACGTLAYVDPLNYRTDFLTLESDIYSLGVVLFEILCGRLAVDFYYAKPRRSLAIWVKHKFHIGTLDEIVFEGIKDQIAPNSLTTFQNIALQCLDNNREKRPTSCDVLQQLQKALEFQEDYEIWEPKLPKDYKEIFRVSNSSDICSTQRAKGLYNTLCNGILLQEGKLLFTLHPRGERNVLISPKTFSYIDHSRHKWRSVPESRFHVVAEMLDIMNLKIKIKTKPQLLSPDVVYGVYLVFKFSDRREGSSKPMYVNLKYRYGSKRTSHAYFATRRDKEWMMIELCRFLNNKKDIVFKFLLESFSWYYVGDTFIYVEGLEFRAIDMNVKHEEIKEVHQILKSNSNLNLLQHSTTNLEDIYNKFKNDDGDEKLFLLNEVKGKKHLMLSTKAALYNYSDEKLFKTKPSTESSFPEVIELLRQQVFRINCKIKSEMLSPDTKYVCYLVFKLSEKCRGLHCPVKVRDLLHRNNKEVEIIYFRSPTPWNLHRTNQAPQQREDGWMEVKVWSMNLNHQLIKNDCFRVNLKLITYEGTMSGLIVCGLEFRPM
ncbi:hypothetical protein LXL04_032398 [Taraxacum kok-saghyz]